MLKQRFITALILFVLLLAALFWLPHSGWVALALGIVMLGLSEWSRLAQLSRMGAQLYWWGSLLGVFGLFYFAAGSEARHPLVQQICYAAAAGLWLLVVPLWFARGWQPRSPWLMALVGWVVLLPTGFAMIDLRLTSPWLLLGVMALVWTADISAYFAGRAFGKHKLALSISPGKTWEGVVGALLGVSLYVPLAVWGAAQAGLLEMPSLSMFMMLLAVSWFWVALSVIGDLFESAAKRQAGVKDSGTLLPGHGGLLDRIDALTSTLPLAALSVMIYRAWS